MSYTLASIAPPLATLAFTPVLTRAVSASEYGTIATSLVVIQTTAMLVALGMPVALTRLVALPSDDGMERGRGLFATGLAVIAVGSLIVAASSPLWWTGLLPIGWGPVAVLGVCAGALSAVVANAQAFFRGSDQVGKFVRVAVSMTIAGQGAGLAGALVSRSAQGYLLGMACGYLGVASIAVFRVLGSGPRSYGHTWQGIKIGAPTIPHQLAFYLSAGALIVIAGREMGVEEAGRLQIALLVGSGAALLLNAMNNSWAVAIYRVERNERGPALESTAIAICWLMAAVSTAVALLAPVLLQLIAPSHLRGADLYAASSLAAGGGLLAVWYLSNVHLVFAEGRTVGLAWTTPLSLAVAVGYAAITARSESIVWVATSLLVFYLVQGIGVAALSRRVSRVRWNQRQLIRPIAVGLLGVSLALPLGTSEVGLWIRAAIAVGLMCIVLLRARQLLRE